MLFSNQTIADFINANFESSWESVRPVPRVKIDFGNGTVLNRTLHGNIATFICDSDGQVVDVLPGVYDAESYLKNLKEVKLAHEYMTANHRQSEFGGTIQQNLLARYHNVRLKTLERGEAFTIAREENAGVSIRGTELPLRVVLNPHARLAARGRMTRTKKSVSLTVNSNMDSLPGDSDIQREKLAANLKRDARVNETRRRQQVHAYLVEQGLTTPANMHKWLYRDVLHADLDDPYLGLGKLLFDSYPFSEEDGITSLAGDDNGVASNLEN